MNKKYFQSTSIMHDAAVPQQYRPEHPRLHCPAAADPGQRTDRRRHERHGGLLPGGLWQLFLLHPGLQPPLWRHPHRPALRCPAVGRNLRISKIPTAWQWGSTLFGFGKKRGRKEDLQVWKDPRLTASASFLVIPYPMLLNGA